MKILNTWGSNSIRFDRKPTDKIRMDERRELADNSQQPYKFALSRTAFLFGLKALGLKSCHSVLVPDFICESGVAPIASAGLEIKYYPVTNRLVPDWNYLKNIKDTNIKAIMIVHYFGQPQDIQRSLEFCRERNLFLIEDNAHGYGSCIQGELLGTFGDLGFCSPRKSFPVTNGSYLYLKGRSINDFSNLILRTKTSFGKKRRIIRLIRSLPFLRSLSNLYQRSNEFRRRKGDPPLYSSQETFREKLLDIPYGMDMENDLYIQSCNLRDVREKRQNIYNIYREWIGNMNLKPVFEEISVESAPLIFPAFSQSSEESNFWYELGHRFGVDIHSWPTLPMSIVNENGRAVHLWERLVCFPIHQDMDSEILKERLRKISAQI